MDIKKILRDQEGSRLIVYDDFNGKEIVPGYVVIGHPTIGVGRALDTNGISLEEEDFLLENDLKRIGVSINSNLTWINDLDEPRKNVIRIMVFNLGMNGFLKFKRMIIALQQKDFDRAASEMLSSQWSFQVKKRAVILAEVMRSGVWPE